VRAQLEAALPRKPRELVWTLSRTDREDADDEARASATLRLVAKDADASVVGRAVSGAAVALAVSSVPGFMLTAPPADATPFGIYRAAYIDAALVPHVAVLPGGRRVDIAPAGETRALGDVPGDDRTHATEIGDEPTVRAPLGRVIGARSGDKGGTANIGVWARTDAAFAWLERALDVAALQRLLPETAPFAVTRHVLPRIRAMNFVIPGLLGEGVASSTRFDPQAKALGEWLRSRFVDIPRSLLA
jgi:hypothetical protein